MTDDLDTKKLTAAAVSGLLLTAAFPKIGASYMAWAALTPLLWGAMGLSFKNGFRLGAVFGLAHYLSLIYWVVGTMHTYGGLSFWVSVPVLFLFSGVLALFPGLFCGLLGPVTARSPSAVITAPVLWTASEFARTKLFSGFPWELLGHSQHPHLTLIQMVDITGVFGLGFLIMLSNVLLLLLFMRLSSTGDKQAPVRNGIFTGLLAVFALLIALAFIYGKSRIQQIDRQLAAAPHRTVSVVQGNIAQNLKWDPDNQIAIIEKYLKLSMTALASAPAPELIVWPETATPFYFLADRALTHKVVSGVKAVGVDVLLGSPFLVGTQDSIQYYNSAFLITAQGHVTNRYDKAHLVPFGEYVPFKKWLPFLGKMVEQVGDFVPGKPGAVLAWGKVGLGIQICYEIIFPSLARMMTANGATLLVNLTNDAWYGISSAPYQHFTLALFRSVENKRSLIRSANTGISGFFDPVGRVLAETPLFKEAVITQKVPLLNTRTIYTRHGDWFAAGCAVLAALLAGAAALRRPAR